MRAARSLFCVAVSVFSVVVACGSDDGGGGGSGGGATGGSGGAATGGSGGATTGGSGGATAGGAAGTGGGAGTGGAGGTGGVDCSGWDGSAAGGADAGADFSCVGCVTWPAPTKTTYTWTEVFTDFQTKAPMVGATVKVCPLADQTCATPLDTKTTDSTGKVTLTAPATTEGVDAYVEITSSTSFPTLQFYVFRNNQVLDGGLLNSTTLSTVSFNLFATVLGLTPDPKRGHVTFGAADCFGKRAAGVSVSLDAKDASTVTAYIAGAVPSDKATATDASGYGGFVNVPVGPAVLSAKIAGTGQVLGTAKVFVRAGYISATNVAATP